MDYCPCGGQNAYLACCGAFIVGGKKPETPESLMRSRYTAYTMGNMDYIQETMRGHALVGFQLSEARSWAKRVHWIKLEVIQAELIDACTGSVEFEASFVEGSSLKSIHERSVFKYEAGCWYYVDGTPLPTSHPEQTILRQTACPCGSPRKFKNCHGRTR